MKTLFLVMFLGTSLYPQSQGGITNGPTAEFRIQAGFSSLPPWPANGVPLVERYPKETYLFIDVATGDYIAYFPESLSPAMAHSKAFRTVRIPLGNKARAQATVRVTRSSAGEFVYDYTVTNKRESIYPLMSWLVAAEVDDESLTMGHPTWRKYGESASVVASSIQHIFAVTEQTSAGTQSTAETVRELSRTAEELRASVARFKVG